MKRTGLWFGLIILAGLLVWLLVRRPTTSVPVQPPAVPEAPPGTPGIRVTTTPVLQGPDPGTLRPTIGEEMLRDYGSTSTTPINDLKLLGALINNMGLLVKNLYERPMSGNEDWASALRGLNPGHQRFLPDNYRIFNADGLLVDRWGTALFLHPVGQKLFDIRSAGPDRKMWTADDIHRDADGSFRESADLNRPGLYDVPVSGRRN